MPRVRRDIKEGSSLERFSPDLLLAQLFLFGCSFLIASDL